MRLEHYDIETGVREMSYEFISKGPKGEIRKIIEFSSSLGSSVFNLGFGDKNTDTGDFDDAVVTDNGDTEKVLATIVRAVYIFCEKFPGALIYATGSTPARTRLYRMGISKYYVIAAADFYIFGQRHDYEWEPFRRDRNYQAFLVTRKEFKFET